MPRLLQLDDLKGADDIFQFFPDAYQSSMSRGWQVDVNEEYPHIFYIHTSNKFLLKQIRKYIEKSGYDDVFFGRIDKSYSYCYNKGHVSEWEESWDRISNYWWKFNFGSEKDMNMMKLQYAEYIYNSEPTYHPEYPWHSEENTRRY